MMKPKTKAIRGISAEYLNRAARPIINIAGLVICIALIAVSALIWFVSQWWGLLLIFIIPVVAVFILVACLVTYVINKVSPNLSKQDKKAVNEFVDKAERITEGVKTPYPIIVLRILWDALRSNDKGLLVTLIEDSKTLAPDFKKLVTTLE